MRFSLPILICLLTAFPASSEPLEFAIYRLTDETRTLIAQGNLDYAIEDVDVVEWEPHDGHQSRRKSLQLAGGFSIGILVFQNVPGPTYRPFGFGLWIQDGHHPDGFSWEWFDQEDGDVYRKLQGEGQVRITRTGSPKGGELRSVEFLTDITLRFQEDIKKGPAGSETHEVVVYKGSVFRFAP